MFFSNHKVFDTNKRMWFLFHILKIRYAKLLPSSISWDNPDHNFWFSINQKLHSVKYPFEMSFCQSIAYADNSHTLGKVTWNVCKNTNISMVNSIHFLKNQIWFGLMLLWNNKDIQFIVNLNVKQQHVWYHHDAAQYYNWIRLCLRAVSTLIEVLFGDMTAS